MHCDLTVATIITLSYRYQILPLIKNPSTYPRHLQLAKTYSQLQPAVDLHSTGTDTVIARPLPIIVAGPIRPRLLRLTHTVRTAQIVAKRSRHLDHLLQMPRVEHDSLFRVAFVLILREADGGIESCVEPVID